MRFLVNRRIVEDALLAHERDCNCASFALFGLPVAPQTKKVPSWKKAGIGTLSKKQSHFSTLTHCHDLLVSVNVLISSLPGELVVLFHLVNIPKKRFLKIPYLNILARLGVRVLT